MSSFDCYEECCPDIVAHAFGEHLYTFFLAKHLPAMQETWVRSLGQEYPLEKEMGNGNPLQYCCLENPMDGGAWWDTVHGVAKSWTRLSNFTFLFSLLEETIMYRSGQDPIFIMGLFILFI